MSLSLIKTLENSPSNLNHFLNTNSAAFRVEIVIGTAGNALGNVEYIGHALPGSTLSQPVWQIMKLVYDASDNVLRVLYANGSEKFNNVFNSGASEYSSYTYSET